MNAQHPKPTPIASMTRIERQDHRTVLSSMADDIEYMARRHAAVLTRADLDKLTAALSVLGKISHALADPNGFGRLVCEER